MSFKIWWGPVPTSLYLPVALAIKRYSFFSVYLPLLKMTLLSTLAIRYVTLGFLAKISFTPLLYHPGGCLGCPEKQKSSRSCNKDEVYPKLRRCVISSKNSNKKVFTIGTSPYKGSTTLELHY